MKRHLSLLIMVLGAGSIYIVSVALRSMLSQQDYGYFGLLVTYIGVIYGFGLFGVEQAILRTTHVSQSGTLIVSRSVLGYLGAAIILGPFVGSFLGVWWIPAVSFSAFYIFSIGVVLTMLIFNLLRLQSNFISAQLVTNLWKMGLCVLLVFYLAVDEFNPNLCSLYKAVTIIFILVPVVFIIKMWRRNIIGIRKSAKGDGFLLLAYMGSLGVITLLNNIDRLLIEYSFNPEIFGYYYYRYVIVVMPLSLMAGYIGFKNLIFYKDNISVRIIRHDVIKTSLFFVVLSVIVLVVIFILGGAGIVEISIFDEFKLIIPLILFGILKGVYSILSAGKGAAGVAKEIMIANAMTMLVLLFSVFVLMLGWGEFWHGLDAIVWLTLVLWGFRIAFVYRCIIKSGVAET